MAIGLCGFGFVVTDGPLIIAWIVFVFVIIVPVTTLTAVQHFKKEGSFRSWLTDEKLGQDVPIPYNQVKSFEVDVKDIATLKKIDSVQESPSQWIIMMNDGRSFELCGQYGNPVHRYFKKLSELRVNLEVGN